MQRINFTSAVLGPKATKNLKNRSVLQTLRSEKASITQAVLNSIVCAGDTVEIVLDGLTIGRATYKSCTKVDYPFITIEDAYFGGFQDRNALRAALLRAGYRFLPQADWHLFRHQFTWQDKPDLQPALAGDFVTGPTNPPEPS